MNAKTLGTKMKARVAMKKITIFIGLAMTSAIVNADYDLLEKAPVVVTDVSATEQEGGQPEVVVQINSSTNLLQESTVSGAERNVSPSTSEPKVNSVTVGKSFLATEYKLGPGDIISVTVFSEPDLSFDNLELSEKGVVTYSFLGEVDALGLTVSEMQKKVSSLLKEGYLKDPKVTISVKKYRQIYLSGAVNSPGGYAYQPGMTVRTLVTLAGGMLDSAADSGIRILSSDGQSRMVSIESPVLPGDTIEIPQLENIYITGAVNKPGSYSFKKGLTIKQAIVIAGGLTERASERKIRVTREIDGEEFDGYMAIEEFAKPGDTIEVGEGFF